VTAHPGGAIVELSYLFVDIRGSTALAETMSPQAFASLVNRFYADATRVLVKSEAFIDKFVGDEVMAVYLPVFCGSNHALAAVNAARALLDVEPRESAGRLPVGVGLPSMSSRVKS